MSPSEPVPPEVLAIAVALAFELAAGEAPAPAGAVSPWRLAGRRWERTAGHRWS